MFDTTSTIKVCNGEFSPTARIAKVTRKQRRPIDWAVSIMTAERKGKKDITLGMNMALQE